MLEIPLPINDGRLSTTCISERSFMRRTCFYMINYFQSFCRLGFRMPLIERVYLKLIPNKPNIRGTWEKNKQTTYISSSNYEGLGIFSFYGTDEDYSLIFCVCICVTIYQSCFDFFTVHQIILSISS